jgi:hypothetical protein
MTITDKYGYEHAVPGPFRSIAMIKQRATGYFFSPETMRFFNSIVEPRVYGGRLFITSEQFVASDGTEFPRFWTIRYASDDGEVGTFDATEYDTLEAADAAAKALTAVYTRN